MNRQLKRANDKSDKRREREQARRRAQRRQSRVRVTKAKDSVKDGAKDGAKSSAAPERDARAAPGLRYPWLVPAYLLLAVGVIASQAFVPQQTDTFSLVVHALFYVILGYFLCLWLYRRGVAQAFVATLAGGLLLAFGVEGLKFALQTEPNLLFAYLALPGLVLGAWLGRFIFQRSA